MVYPDIGSVLAQWEAAGVFEFLLPFLLVFAIVFGVLSATNVLGSQRGVHVLVAIVVGLLSLQLRFVPEFMREVFPRLGVGLTVVLALLVLIGLFVPKDERRYWLWGLGAIAFIAAVVVVSKSFSQLGWAYGTVAQDYVGWIAGAVLVIGLIIAIAASGGKERDPNKQRGIAIVSPWDKT